MSSGEDAVDAEAYEGARAAYESERLESPRDREMAGVSQGCVGIRDTLLPCGIVWSIIIINISSHCISTSI